MNDRVSRLRARLTEWHVDGVLITNATNRRWLSGFTGSAGSLLITAERAILSTDSRYWEQATQQSPYFELYQHRNEKDSVLNFLKSGNVKRIGIEAKSITVSEIAGLKKLPGFEWIYLESTVENFRTTKSAEEIDAIRTAARITDQTVAQVVSLAKPGISEKQLAWELEKYMREAGADRLGFDIIVASGPNSALPHHQPGERQLKSGDIIVVDLGAEVAGYKSDLTRTFYLGQAADEQFHRVFDTVLAAQTACISGLRPGLTGKEADALARDVINDSGFGEYFGHGTGHGVGLDIHEEPRLFRLGDTVVLPPRAVITVEPGIYLPGWGGVRIEDLVYLGSDGIEILSHAPKNPLIP